MVAGEDDYEDDFTDEPVEPEEADAHAEGVPDEEYEEPTEEEGRADTVVTVEVVGHSPSPLTAEHVLAASVGADTSEAASPLSGVLSSLHDDLSLGLDDEL